jgi:hypothetical protein
LFEIEKCWLTPLAIREMLGYSYNLINLDLCTFFGYLLAGNPMIGSQGVKLLIKVQIPNL